MSANGTPAVEPRWAATSRLRSLRKFLFPIVIEEVAEIVLDIPFRGEVGRFLCQLLDGLVAFPRDRIARINLSPRPAEGRKRLTGHLQVQIARHILVTLSVKPFLSFASTRLLTSCARQLVSKINPVHRRRLAGHKPAGRKSTTPFAVPRKGGRLPSHARESYPDRIRILSQSGGEFAGLRLQ